MSCEVTVDFPSVSSTLQGPEWPLSARDLFFLLQAPWKVELVHYSIAEAFAPKISLNSFFFLFLVPLLCRTLATRGISFYTNRLITLTQRAPKGKIITAAWPIIDYAHLTRHRSTTDKLFFSSLILFSVTEKPKRLCTWMAEEKL